jgi:hypothetical protein
MKSVRYVAIVAVGGATKNEFWMLYGTGSLMQFRLISARRR